MIYFELIATKINYGIFINAIALMLSVLENKERKKKPIFIKIFQTRFLLLNFNFFKYVLDTKKKN